MRRVIATTPVERPKYPGESTDFDKLGKNIRPWSGDSIEKLGCSRSETIPADFHARRRHPNTFSLPTPDASNFIPTPPLAINSLLSRGRRSVSLATSARSAAAIDPRLGPVRPVRFERRRFPLGVFRERRYARRVQRAAQYNAARMENGGRGTSARLAFSPGRGNGPYLLTSVSIDCRGKMPGMRRATLIPGEERLPLLIPRRD